MTTELLVAVVGLAGTLLGTVVGVLLGHMLTSRSAKRRSAIMTKQRQVDQFLVPIQRLVDLAPAAAEIWSRPHSGTDGHIHSPESCNQLKSTMAVLLNQMETAHRTALNLGLFDFETDGTQAKKALVSLTDSLATIGKLHNKGTRAQPATVGDVLHMASHVQMQIARVKERYT